MTLILLLVLLQVLPSPSPALDFKPKSPMPGIAVEVESPFLYYARATENWKQVVLRWNHPDCYRFEIRQVSDGKTNIMERLFYNGSLHQKKHQFERKVEILGRTNVFTIRAWDVSNTAASDWSNTQVLISTTPDQKIAETIVE